MAASTRLMARSLSWLAETSWSYLLGLVFFIVTSGLIVTIAAAPGSVRAAMGPLATKAALLLMLAKMLSQYRGFQRLQTASARGATLTHRGAALIPLPLIAWSRLDRANLRACLAWIARRPHPPRPPGRTLYFLQKSSYGTVVMILLVGIFGELPMHATIVSVMVKEAALQHQVQLILLALALYSLFWVVGDRRAMLGSSYVVGLTALDLKVGNRFSASIPLKAITSCEAVSGGEGEWRKRRGLPRGVTLVATPADVPNVMIAIDPAAGVKVVHWQIERPAPAYLFLFADEASQLIGALKFQIENGDRDGK